MIRRAAWLLFLSAVLVSPASATWSILVVNRRTGEVAIAAATCLPITNLLRGLPTVVPGVGVGVIQASGNSSDLVPLTLGLRAGLPPADILELVLAADPNPDHLQAGVVALYEGAPVTYTGIGAGRAKWGVAGEIGDLAYAIQGNVLAGANVVTAAEVVLRNAPGDLGQKVLAAMQRARILGGDGRCSCSDRRPGSCGAPPPSFQKSAHCGFLVVARIGDPDSDCQRGPDCAERRYYLRLNVAGTQAQEDDPDPVDQLTTQYAAWRAARRGRPDGIRSTVDAVDSLPADGSTKSIVTVRLVDLDGVALDHGGARVRVTTVGDARSHAAVGPVADMGDGTYLFTLSSTERVGTDRLVITAQDSLVKATLYPYLEVRSEAPAALHVGRDGLSATSGGSVPFVLTEPGFARGAYAILCSASGTVPALRLASGVTLPLVLDRWSVWSLSFAGDPSVLPGTLGTLDGSGRAEATVVAPPGALLPLVGKRLSWAAVVVSGSELRTTPAVGFQVLP